MADVWREYAQEHRELALDLLNAAKRDDDPNGRSPGVLRTEAQVHATLANACAALAVPLDDEADEKSAGGWPHPDRRR